MSTARLIELALRRERLIARAEQQRAVIAVAGMKWRKPFSMVDRGIAVVAYLKAHPLILGVAVAGVVAVGYRNLPRWIGRGFFVWRAWRVAGALIRNPGS